MVDIRGKFIRGESCPQAQKRLKFFLKTLHLLQLMHISFDPTHTEPCVDVPESHDEEINEGGGRVPSDNQFYTAYSNSTCKMVFYRDDETTAAWEKASRSGSGPVSENRQAVSGNRSLISMFRPVLHGTTSCVSVPAS